MSSIKFRTKRIFPNFHILKTNRMMSFCNLFMERSSYIVTISSLRGSPIILVWYQTSSRMSYWVTPCGALNTGEASKFRDFRPTIPRCPDGPCQHGLVRSAGESITHMQQRRHHMTVCCLKLSSFVTCMIDEMIDSFSITRTKLVLEAGCA